MRYDAALRDAAGFILEEAAAMPIEIEPITDPYLLELMRKSEGVGRMKGVVEGEARTLLRQIERRFGPADADHRVRIAEADPEQLERWLDQILDAPSLDVLFQDSARLN